MATSKAVHTQRGAQGGGVGAPTRLTGGGGVGANEAHGGGGVGTNEAHGGGGGEFGANEAHGGGVRTGARGGGGWR